MDGWMNDRIDGWMDGRMDELIDVWIQMVKWIDRSDL